MSTSRSEKSGLPLLERLPEAAAALVERASAASDALSARTYLVGGIVRDLLLGRASLDLDLAVVGDAIALARAIAASSPGRLVTHHDFGTATLHVDGLVLDLATTRTESYSHPGALPLVKAGSIQDDLRRRDFTINAMALPLNSPDRGTILDPLGGGADLRAGLVRVIHDHSFIDDATRMLRAVRYEQRLGFHLEAATEALLRLNAGMLNTISGERARYELERAFTEERPAAVLARTAETGLLQALHPALRWEEDKARGFKALTVAKGSRLAVGAAILTKGLSVAEINQVAERLRFPKAFVTAAKDAQRALQTLPIIQASGVKPSEVSKALTGLSRDGIEAAKATAQDPVAQNALRLFLEVLSATQTTLTGRDLLAMDVPQGPTLGEALAALKAARLDGDVSTREEETAWVTGWLAKRPRSRGN